MIPLVLDLGKENLPAEKTAKCPNYKPILIKETSKGYTSRKKMISVRRSEVQK